ncbi:DUF1127 domain-containing protein [Candidatus Rhodobacter oscarellae]|uniref:DUF1127 domain-containing protein n=1 Tax=Candidatus Rhodobacter oscarellae TaxID=1675527 RepID=UPI0006715B21
MLQHHEARSLGVGKPITKVGAWAIRWLHRFRDANRARRQRQALLGMNDKMLADIGLTRSDLTNARSRKSTLRDPFWQGFL